ncbi:MAG: hypothetical protein EPO06_07095 [Burkholderiaceae bacterium]|nr:MAG: hypothetical protein EPO06_07095 [Burkholderiaceae bacterium]
MSIKRALVLSYCERYGNLFLGLIATMVLSRLLTPAEVGVFSIGMLIIGLVAVIRDLDASSFLIQTPELTRDRIRAAFTVSLGLGIFFALLLWLLAPACVKFYKEPRLGEVIHLLAFSFLLVPFGANTQAILTREMRFGALLVIRITQPVVSTITSVTLALQGYGTLSLAWGMLAGSISIALATTLFRPKNLPLLPGLRSIGEVLHFGLRKTSASILSELRTGAPEIVLGKTLGFAVSGIFSRANGLAQMFSQLILNAIYRVAFAHFSKNQRNDSDCSKTDYLYAIQIILALAWPFFFVLSWNAEAVLYVLYGQQWLGAAPILRVLCLSVSMGMPFALASTLLIASGNVTNVLRNEFTITPIYLILVAAAAFHSAEAVALAIVASTFISAALWLRSLKQHHQIGWGDMTAAMLPALKLTGIVALACLAGSLVPVPLTVGHWALLITFAINAALSLAAYAFLLYRMQHPIIALIGTLLGKA